MMGPVVVVLIPESLGFTGYAEIGRALLAWQYDLGRDDIAILEHVARGRTNSEIAEAMSIAEENTVANRLKTVLRKLQVPNRTRAAAVAAQYGLATGTPSQFHRDE